MISKIKKPVSIILALMMIVSLFTIVPITASAAEGVAKINDTTYETLEAAFAAAEDGDTITVLANCAGNGIKAPQGKFATGLTVDFGGHTYTVDGSTVGSTGTETNGFQLLMNNKVNFLNGTIYSKKAKILVQNYSNLTLDNMTLTLDNPNYSGAYTLSNNNGNIVIDSTTINANPAGGFAFDVCRYASYPSVNVTVKGDSVINGDVEVSASGGDAKDGFSLNLVSGEMYGKVVTTSSAATAMAANPDKAGITEDTTNFKHYVAKIGDNKYETLEAAFADAQDGNTITVLADCAGNGIKVTPAGKFADKGLTVNFNGHTYTVDGSTVGSTGTETQAFQLLKNNKVKFLGGTIYSEKAKILVQNYSNLDLEGMTLTLKNPNYTSAYTLSNNNGEIEINNTTINANPAGGFAFDVCRGGGSKDTTTYPSVSVTVTGNSAINGDVEVSTNRAGAADGFSLNLESGTMTGNIVLDQTAKNVIENTPEKAEVTKKNTFTKAAPEGYEWKDNGDGTSTLAKVADLFPAHSISLADGDINLNFYVNKAAIPGFDSASSVVVKFAWDFGETHEGINDFSEVNLKTADAAPDGTIKANCKVNAAQMAYPITATVYVNGAALDRADNPDTYSVKQYAEKMIANPDTLIPDESKRQATVDFLKAMLNYGGMAQRVFDRHISDQDVPYADEKVRVEFTDEMEALNSEIIKHAIHGQGTSIENLKAIGRAMGGEWYTTSVIFLSQNTIRHYFDDVTEGGLNKDGLTQYEDTYIYYTEKTGITPDKLDDSYTFNAGGQTFKYSVLDYAAAVLDSGMDRDAQNLAKALFLYNQAANALFED